MEGAAEIFKRKLYQALLSPSARRSPGRAKIVTGAVAVTAAFSGDGHFLSWGGRDTHRPDLSTRGPARPTPVDRKRFKIPICWCVGVDSSRLDLAWPDLT